MSKNNYQIKPVSDKNAWEQLLENFPESNFLQSYNWGVFQESLGKKVLRFSLNQEERVVGAFQVVKEAAARGPYLSVAGGPLIDWQNPDMVSIVVDKLKQLAGQESCWFTRFRPQAIDNPKLTSLLCQLGVKKSPMHLTADLTLQLDLTLSLEEILKQMRKNHRNLIKRAERDGITTEVSTNPEFVKEFDHWQQYLAKKHNFVPFSFEYLDKQFKTFASDGQAYFVSSYLGDKLLASAYLIIYNQEAVYHYGISTPENDKLPGSLATQWRAIGLAKELGCKKYNFWGVAPDGDKNHRFAGVSMFKRGFGGEEVHYLPAHDIVVSPMYFFTKIFESIRKVRRKL